MRFKKQKIKGVFLIQPEPFIDERGIFRRNFCKKEFSKNKLIYHIEQCNISENKYKHTLRGFHYQTGKYGEGKTFTCIRGKIFDIVVDLRKFSRTYKKWISFEISDLNRNSIHIPPGCANAFLTLEKDTVVHYYCSNSYSPQHEKGIKYNDKDFKFKWPVKPKIISQKDRNHDDFKDTDSIV